MKTLSMIAVLFCSALILSSCSQPPKAANSEQAIEQSKTLKTPDEQAKYLVGQADAFVNSKEFNEAVETAQYVLANLDASSADAKKVLEEAAEEMKKVAMQKADELKKSLGNFGKE